MGLNNLFVAVLGAALLAWSGASIADEYRADEFLGLDLSKAVLSPKRLGPESESAPVAVEAQNAGSRHAGKPRGVARTRLAHRHGNPLDAQAQDTRVQAWPCKSGGICNWK